MLNCWIDLWFNRFTIVWNCAKFQYDIGYVVFLCTMYEVTNILTILKKFLGEILKILSINENISKMVRKCHVFCRVEINLTMSLLTISLFTFLLEFCTMLWHQITKLQWYWLFLFFSFSKNSKYVSSVDRLNIHNLRLCQQMKNHCILQLNTAGVLYSQKQTTNAFKLCSSMLFISYHKKKYDTKNGNKHFDYQNRKRNGKLYMKSLLCDKRFISSLGKHNFCFSFLWFYAFDLTNKKNYFLVSFHSHTNSDRFIWVYLSVRVQ